MAKEPRRAKGDGGMVAFRGFWRVMVSVDSGG